jgi:HlyD family secretion protein
MRVSAAAIAVTAGAAMLAAPSGNDVVAQEAASSASVPQVAVIRAQNACFSESIRVTGYLVAAKEAIVPLSQGDKVTEVSAGAGSKVTADQVLAHVDRQTPDPAKAGTMKTDNVALKAPAAGVVTQSTAFIGGTVSPVQRDPLFRIAVDGEIELEAEVPASYVQKLAVGQTARVQLPDGVEVSGRVRLLPAQIDQKTQLGHARISMDRNAGVRYGMFVRAAINAERSCGISVPNAAVTYRTDGSSVQVVRNDIIETRNIQLGIYSDTTTEVRKGLSEGDLIVASAGTSLRDGDRVKAIEPESNN